MKLFVSLFVVFVLVVMVTCNPAQPQSSYELYSNTVPTAVKYHFFLEKKNANPYQLVDNMDYLAPDVTALKVGEATTPIFEVTLPNDGFEYMVGVVAENVSGFYSGMGVGVGTVGLVPTKPGNVGLRKK